MYITLQEKQTIAFYECHAQSWSDLYSLAKESFWKDELQLFKDYLPNGKILEIGVGGGQEAAHFIKVGYDYTGIDPAATLIQIAQERLPKGTFIQKSMYDLDFPAASFDGFWCAAVLLHVPPLNISYALEKIKNVIKPGGTGFISLAQGQGEYFDQQTGRWFYLYDSKDFEKILHNHFVVEKKAFKKHDTSKVWLQTWITFFVRRC